MRILAIETSCDETALSLLDISGPLEKPLIKVLGNALLSQVKLHEKYGGVYPNLAKREHQKNLPILLDQVLSQARSQKLESSDIDYIAVTYGPGLEPALWTGIVFAQELSEKWQKPVVPVDHMEGHIFSILYEAKIDLELPALALLVSGGHTELVHVKDFGLYEIIGRTRDDAIGEAFDKTARMLGLPYPGGPEISKLAKIARGRGGEDTIKLPRPMIHSKDLDFSFSGLKTAVLYKIKAKGSIDDNFKEDMARAFEESAIETIVEKTKRAILSLETNIKTVIVGGGVSANTYLTQELETMLEQFPELKLRIPKRELATDNAIMIGIAGSIRIEKNPSLLNSKDNLRARGNLSLTSS